MNNMAHVKMYRDSYSDGSLNYQSFSGQLSKYYPNAKYVYFRSYSVISEYQSQWTSNSVFFLICYGENTVLHFRL